MRGDAAPVYGESGRPKSQRASRLSSGLEVRVGFGTGLRRVSFHGVGLFSRPAGGENSRAKNPCERCTIAILSAETEKRKPCLAMTTCDYKAWPAILVISREPAGHF